MTQHDVMLSTLLDDVEETGRRVDLTISSGGLLIAGTVVSEEEYLGLLDDGSAEEGPTPKRSVVVDEFRARRERIRAFEAEMMAGADIPDGVPRTFVNDAVPRPVVTMKDAVVVGAHSPPITMRLWRGLVSGIDGWTFGKPGLDREARP